MGFNATAAEPLPPLEANVFIPSAAPAAPMNPNPSPPAPERWELMQALQGTYYGAALDDNRITIMGWVEGSYTASTDRRSNQPLVFNDRANKFLLDSVWIRLERSVLTTGTSEITWGWRIDNSFGSDYRFSLQRGLLNSQLENSTGAQNLYGYDPIQFYANAYIPNLFAGTDIRAGRLFTPWGYESLEGVSTPCVSRSYAFNWSPPFTHMGIQVSPTFNAQWSGKFLLANGNDVFFDSPQEVRFVGAITWTSITKADTITYGWSYGRGKFTTGNPFNPATTGEQTEPAGRNNLNTTDIVYQHTFNPILSYATEIEYGYQSDVPANVPGGIITSRPVTSGTAHWFAVAQYLNWQIAPKVMQITRFEVFDDCNGQRTGFSGVYDALTVGWQYRPSKSWLIRPEVRLDYIGDSRPFEGKHHLTTAALDVIYRW